MVKMCIGHKIDPYTCEVIEISMDARGAHMGPDTDARAGQFASDTDVDYDHKYRVKGEYQHTEPLPRVELPKPVVPAIDRRQSWVRAGISEKVAQHLYEYMCLLVEEHKLTFEQYLRAESLAVEEAKKMCENPGREKDMWNHVPSTRSQRIARTRFVKKSARVPEPKEQTVSGYATTTNGKVVTLDEAAVTALSKAIRHVDRISRRDHIKADRVERVNLFLTSLRRELGYFASVTSGHDMVGSLCNKALWYEPGVLNLNLTGVYGLRYSKDTIQKWLDAAKRQRDSTESARDLIEGDLEDLERSLNGVVAACDDAQRINQEGESVASELCHLFE